MDKENWSSLRKLACERLSHRMTASDIDCMLREPTLRKRLEVLVGIYTPERIATVSRQREMLNRFKGIPTEDLGHAIAEHNATICQRLHLEQRSLMQQQASLVELINQRLAELADLRQALRRHRRDVLINEAIADYNERIQALQAHIDSLVDKHKAHFADPCKSRSDLDDASENGLPRPSGTPDDVFCEWLEERIFEVCEAIEDALLDGQYQTVDRNVFERERLPILQVLRTKLNAAIEADKKLALQRQHLTDHLAQIKEFVSQIKLALDQRIQSLHDHFDALPEYHLQQPKYPQDTQGQLDTFEGDILPYLQRMHHKLERATKLKGLKERYEQLLLE